MCAKTMALSEGQPVGRMCVGVGGRELVLLCASISLQMPDLAQCKVQERSVIIQTQWDTLGVQNGQEPRNKGTIQHPNKGG